MKAIDLINKKKLTKATFKSFLKANEGKLFIKRYGGFDGMIDGWSSSNDNNWYKLTKADRFHENNLGYSGIWLVNGGDRFYLFTDSTGKIGIEVYNCCEHFVVAIDDPEVVLLSSLK